MKVFYHSALARVELSGDGAFSTVPCKAHLEIEPDKGEQDYEAIFNGVPLEPGQLSVEVYANAELLIRHQGEKQRYVVKPLAHMLSGDCSRAYEQFLDDYQQITSPELDAIISGDLKLYAVDYSMAVEDYTEIFDKIEGALPAMRAICEKPKSHLRSVNEVRPIETVKRIGYESIPYLAAHSEDWLARTASGLKPARLFSRVEDDEYQIYENRVVKTLIDLIIVYLRKTEKTLRNQSGQLGITMNSGVQLGGFGFDVRFHKALSELRLSDSQGEARRHKARILADRMSERAHSLLKKYCALRQTRLYRYLRKAKPVPNPLNETNIMLMDRQYSVVFRLWKSVHRILAPQKSDDDEKTEIGYAGEGYLHYCKVLCGYTAHVLNFEPMEDGHYFRRGDHLDCAISAEGGALRVTLRDRTRRYLEVAGDLQIPIPPGTEYHSFSYDGVCLRWENDTTEAEIDRFCALFKSRESRGRELAEGRKRYSSLKKAILRRQQDYSAPACRCFVLIPAAVELENDNRTTFRDYVIAAGEKLARESDADAVVFALPVCSESEQKTIAYAKHTGDRVLVLPLTLFDINSFRRLQNVFLRQILSLDASHCPCCGEPMREKDSQWVCDSCNQLIVTRTQCANPDCKHEYAYLGYEVSEDTVEKMSRVDRENFYQIDSLFQYLDIVDMVVSDGKIHAVCPCCRG